MLGILKSELLTRINLTLLITLLVIFNLSLSTIVHAATFDFTLTNGGAKSVTAGSSVTNSITSTLIGTPTGVQYVQDNFSGVNGTALASHTPTTGSGWVDDQAGIKILNNQLETVNFGDGRSHNNVTPTSPNYEVSADITMNVKGWGNKAGVRGRDAGSRLGNAYEAYYNDGTGQWRLDKWVGFNNTNLGSFAQTFPIGTTHTIKLGLVGSSITVYIDGVSRIAVTDSSIAIANHPGIYSAGGIHDGMLIDNYFASDSGASTPAINFTASGLPNATTASFTPASCVPSCSTTLTLNTQSSTIGGIYNILVTATGAGVSRSTNFDLTVNTPPPDTTAPTVSISSPVADSTVSGTITVSANASDNVAVTGVQFKLDDNNLGVEDTSLPYSVSWNTLTTTNGLHTLSAVARDTANNTATATPISVTVNNTTPTPTPIPTPTPSPTPTPIPTPTPPAGTWVNIDPAGVSNNPTNPGNNFGFNSIVIDPTTPTTVYLGTNYQGLYKSLNSGVSWNKTNTGAGGSMLDSGRMWTLAIDPFNPQTIYTTAGAGVQGVLKSTDSGVTWTQMFGSNGLNLALAQQLQTNDVYTISLDPYVPNHVLASFHYYWHGNQDSGLIESTDGGQTWVIRNPKPGWGAGNGVWFGNNSNTWILGSQNNGFWISIDSGQNWRQFSTTSMTHGATEALYRNPISQALFVADQTTVLKSSDNGTTWQNIGGGLQYSYYETVIGDGNRLFTAPSFPIQGDNGSAHSPWLTLSETASSGWLPYNSQQPCDPAGYCNGPVMAGYDSVNHIVYTVNWNGGVWKLQE